MSILINKNTRVITQGITGKTGQFHTEKCQEYANGKNCFVAGVNPKKAGESIFGIPIFGTVKMQRKKLVRPFQLSMFHRQGLLLQFGKPLKQISI